MVKLSRSNCHDQLVMVQLSWFNLSWSNCHGPIVIVKLSETSALRMHKHYQVAEKSSHAFRAITINVGVSPCICMVMISGMCVLPWAITTSAA